MVVAQIVKSPTFFRPIACKGVEYQTQTKESATFKYLIMINVKGWYAEQRRHQLMQCWDIYSQSMFGAARYFSARAAYVALTGSNRHSEAFWDVIGVFLKIFPPNIMKCAFYCYFTISATAVNNSWIWQKLAQFKHEVLHDRLQHIYTREALLSREFESFLTVCSHHQSQRLE